MEKKSHHRIEKKIGIMVFKSKKQTNKQYSHQLPGPEVDVRRWRFIVIGPSATLGGRGAGITPLVNPVNSELDCDRGRVVDEASLGSVDTPPFRELLLGVPEARFLQARVSRTFITEKNN